jgi:hypothetical protein
MHVQALCGTRARRSACKVTALRVPPAPYLPDAGARGAETAQGKLQRATDYCHTTGPPERPRACHGGLGTGAPLALSQISIANSGGAANTGKRKEQSTELMDRVGLL